MATLATQPYNLGKAITTSNTIDFPLVGGTRRVVDAIYIGGAGTLAAVMDDDSVVTFTCIAGQTLPFRCKRINATGTTATLLVGLYVV